MSEACLPQIGCTDGYICDVNDKFCRKPDASEICNIGVGCQYGLKCVNGTCAKPNYKEACQESVGCFEGYRCSNSTCQISTFGHLLIIYQSYIHLHNLQCLFQNYSYL